ncbi:MAG: signal peptidase I [Candidatus Pacebacteria bacterium]|nr:signal peptidase I [Candidatus Paceibacterota bacterium]
MQRFWASLWEVIKTIAIAGIVVFGIRALLFQPFLVSGPSMEPNISQSNYLIIDELTYRFREPMRGEVVVFRYPGDKSTFYIKRILGLPNEQVDVADGAVSVNGVKIDESAYLKGINTSGDVHTKLDGGYYFVMGDNRSNSYDSRAWGPLEKKHIVGRALLRLFPFNRISVFQEQTYITP